jgi:hypothetical protein
MRPWTLIAVTALLAGASGCIDFPVEEWERGHARRTRQPAVPVEYVAVPSGETNIYITEPVYYAGPVYSDYTRVRRRGYSNFNVFGTGTYRGVNYGVGYGGGSGYGYNYSGGYGYASGTKGKTSWTASWGR